MAVCSLKSMLSAKAATVAASKQAEIVKVTDIAQIAAYGLMSTPGLVIDEKVVCSGRVPSKTEVTTFITTAMAGE